MTTAYWSPNQAAIAQVETYTFSAPNSIGNTYIATINGKSVTYTSIGGDTAALAATGLYNLLNISSSVAPELLEITFTNPSSGTLTATARVAGTPFANVPGTSSGLVLSTGNGLVNGITTVHTKANASPSDVNDPQNWLRVTSPGVSVRQLPTDTDDVVVANSNVSMLWNLDQLSAKMFNTYTRWQSFTGTIGLPSNNPGGYTEWRATYFKIGGPPGSTPTGGLKMILGFSSGSSGSGPSRERYDLGVNQATVQAIAAGPPVEEYGIRFLGSHVNNNITAENGVSVGVAMQPGEVATLNHVIVSNGATVGIGVGVTWSVAYTGIASYLTAYGSTVILNSPPATVTLRNGTQATFATDALTWPTIDAQNGCTLTWLAGGYIGGSASGQRLIMSQGCTLDKSQDSRTLSLVATYNGSPNPPATPHTIDGDTCVINDPLNAITYTNAVTVKQQVSSGPFRFTGTRTVQVT